MKRKILIAAGGTGGHIFPALAFGRWILDNGKAESVVYVSGSRPLEAEIYSSHGVTPYRLALSGSPLGGNLWSGLKRCAGLFRSFFDMKNFLRRERPDVCFLFGSYVSAAPLLWCKLSGVPMVAHEQNACAGKVTKLASRMGVPAASGWGECRGVSGAFHTGVPVRSFKRLARAEAASALGVEAEDGGIVIGVVGGSLGSSALSGLLGKMPGGAVNAAGHTLEGRTPTFVVLGDKSGDSFGGRVKFVGRRWDMAPFYSLCDGVVCRAGASTLAELAAFGIPSLTIPWGGAADGHQEANAKNFSAMTDNFVWSEADGEDALAETFGAFLERAASARKPSGDFMNDAASSALWRFMEEKYPSL